MMNLRRTTLAAFGIVLSLAIAACGVPGASPVITPNASAVADTSAQDFTPDETRQAADLNQSGALATKDLSEYESAVGRSATTVATAPVADSALDLGGFTSVQHVVKIGYVRTTLEGKFLLSLSGTVKPSELTGSDGKRDSRIAGYVNHKVILWGIFLPSGQLMVEHILAIPTFHVITDLFLKGRLAGNVFLSSNHQGLVGALVTAKQASTGFIFRTQTDRSGNFSFSGLDPDVYTLIIGLGGFKGTTQENLNVLKGKKTSLMIPLNPS